MTGVIVAGGVDQTQEPASADVPALAVSTDPRHARVIGRMVFMERQLERTIFASRWLLAPLYFGLIAALVVLVVKFVEALWHMLGTVSSFSMSEVTLAVLELLDIALLGNLILIVIFSGYENFVSKIKVAQGSEDRPSWMGRVDFSGLKIKLIGSLVAISVIELLKDFLAPGDIDPEQEKWRIAIHLTFVVSGVLFAVMDYIADKRASIDIRAQRDAVDLRNAGKASGLSDEQIAQINPTGE